MELWIALFLLLFVLIFHKRLSRGVPCEGFDPLYQDRRPEHYPDQSKYGDLIAAQKYIQLELNSPELEEGKKTMLIDLLNLLQFI
jgi:hypothetical protein